MEDVDHRPASRPLPRRGVSRASLRRRGCVLFLSFQDPEMALSGELRYIAVTMKKLNRGQPLLPLGQVTEGILQWEDADISLGLSRYLRIFLVKLGCSELAEKIYDRLDGRRVLCYQAVVQENVLPFI